MDEACREFRRGVVLGEAPGPHAEGCPTCRSFRDVEQATSSLVRARAPRYRASATLRERITLAIEHEVHRRPARRRMLVAVALASAAVVAIVVGLLATRDDRGTEHAGATAAALVTDHLAYAHRVDRLQITSSSPAELERWFEAEVELAVRLPELAGARLVGARRCRVAGRSAALAFYDRSGEPVSVFVFAPAGEDWSAMHEIQARRGKRTCRHHDRGVGLVVWEERGLVYAVASALDAAELEDLVR